MDILYCTEHIFIIASVGLNDLNELYDTRCAIGIVRKDCQKKSV